MKTLLDLKKLCSEGKITEREYQKLMQYTSQDVTSLAFNIFIGFGVISVSCASIALVPTAFTAITLGIIISLFGLSPLRFHAKWQLLSQICALIGALLLCGGILWLFMGSTHAWILVTILLATVGILTRHGLLIVLSVLSLSATLGSSSEYYHASYFIIIDHPSMTIAIFGLLSVLTYWGSLYLPSTYETLAILASRTALFMVNIAFWVGSLWGDKISPEHTLSEMPFIIAWALGLILVATWAIRTNHRWALNICGVFGAIHLYTQWFERLGATPLSVLMAGMVALLLALVIHYLNRMIKPLK